MGEFDLNKTSWESIEMTHLHALTKPRTAGALDEFLARSILQTLVDVLMSFFRATKGKVI